MTKLRLEILHLIFLSISSYTPGRNFRETLCESGRRIDALKRRRRALKNRRRVLKKRGRLLKKLFLVRETGVGPLLQKGGMASQEGGGVLKNPVEVLKEFDPLLPTLSVSP